MFNEGLEQDVSKKQAVVAGKNFIKNGRFSNSTSGYSTSGTMTATVIDNGVDLLGNGYFYQSLNSNDLVNGQNYTVAVYVTSIVSGTWTVNIGTSITGSQTATKTLSAGWNQLPFTAGATCHINFNGSATDAEIKINELKIQPQVNLRVSGGILLGDNIKLDDNWRIRVSGTAVYLEYSTDGFTTVSWAGTLGLAE